MVTPRIKPGVLEAGLSEYEVITSVKIHFPSVRRAGMKRISIVKVLRDPKGGEIYSIGEGDNCMRLIGRSEAYARDFVSTHCTLPEERDKWISGRLDGLAFAAPHYTGK